MITQYELFTSPDNCCGCGSCVDVCPKSVLSMEADKSGFLYPQIKNQTSCIDCRQCVKVCPEKNYESIDSCFIGYYAGSLENEAELVTCASGGLATAISRTFLMDGGVVYGCTYSQDWKSIEYKRLVNQSELDSIKGSKYAQSTKGNVYHRIEKDLSSGLKVLFIGLPCDVLAVKNRVPQKFAENIYLVELICHGPTSQEAHRQYLEKFKNNKTVTFFSTRWKKSGLWKPFYINIKFNDGNEHIEQFHKSQYGAAFKYLKRPSCYSCGIKGKHLAGDLMIGDYHYVEYGMKGYNEHGVSSALVHNKKGRTLIESVNGNGFCLLPIPERNVIGNAAINRAISAPPKQALFEQVFIEHGLDCASKLPFVIMSKIKQQVRKSIVSTCVRIKRIIIPSSRPTN